MSGRFKRLLSGGWVPPLGFFALGVAATLSTAVLVGFAAMTWSLPRSRKPPTSEVVERENERENELRRHLLRALVARAGAEVEDDGEARLDLLLLSGGAQYGAFAAGVLEGWGQSQTQPRPHFDLVTGVSAGAMLAPSAFIDRGDVLGSEAIEALFVRAREAWSLTRPTAYMPWRASVLNPAPLREAIHRSTPADAIERIAEEGAEGRRLLVMATNIDLGRPTVWDLTRLAASSTGAAVLRERILASASLPPLFPPVEIEGSLHADGGASHLFFLGPRFDLLDDLYVRLEEAELALRTSIHVWVVVSSPIWPSVSAVTERWPRVTYRVATLGLYALTRADLQRVHRAVLRVASKPLLEASFRFLAVPPDLDRERTLAGPEFVRSLKAAGRALGRRGAWQSELPRVEAQ